MAFRLASNVHKAARSAGRHLSTAAAPEVIASNRVFGGTVTRFSHKSDAVGTTMGYSVFTPGGYEGKQLPTLYWLSGLTCDDTNFTFKAGAFEHLAEHGCQIVCPDTSPRGLDLPGEHDAYDFGSGAGFYISSTTPDYAGAYQMFDYVTDELPRHIEAHTQADPAIKSVLGHSMGGLGALNCYLKTDVFRSVSAFSPICNPVNCPWGKKAFTGYLGACESTWGAWDPSVQLHGLVDSGAEVPHILVSQGTADTFLDEQLLTTSLPAHANIDVRMEEGYDHSYYFISSFIGQHIDFHAKQLAL